MTTDPRKKDIRNIRKMAEAAIPKNHPTSVEYANAYKEAKEALMWIPLNTPVFVVFSQQTKKLIVCNAAAIAGDADKTVIRIFFRTTTGYNAFTFKDGDFL